MDRKILEKKDFFNELFQQRKRGEVNKSLLLLAAMGVIVNTVFWGIFGSKLTVIAAVLCWGIGDAAAALVGQKFGRHKIPWRIADGKKNF